ncbi:MAG TPA: LysR family transcriptional regulator [Amaricoccus sp.]|uniref:LysR family transcriptional regulator n=1 Tax=Amaricoccus sp. TaxID=1872485 RepID=UPI002CBD6175|nr:LysR family transcriptional regulator [Amaricoccus sp.]HMR34228.1 LysR family transcriptional regulator [Geminicoccus sp.]HMU00778.1 LysR family transcriptional regulator [Amaricoccus sp.]
MTLNFRELEIVWSVLRTGSIKKAAAALHVSQPAVSMMLKNAEERFGIQLCDRSTGRLRPTAEALALLPSINAVFHDIENLERHLARVRDQHSGSLKIAANQTIAAGFVYRALASFHSRRPQVSVVVRSFSNAETVELVEQREVDMGLAYGPAESDEIRAEKLYSTQLVCALHHAHPLACKNVITAEDLSTVTVVSYRADSLLGKEIARACASVGVTLPVAVQATTLAAAHLANQGFGVALIDPNILGVESFSHVVVRPFSPSIDAHVHLLTRTNEPQSMLAQEFQKHLKSFRPAYMNA